VANIVKKGMNLEYLRRRKHIRNEYGTSITIPCPKHTHICKSHIFKIASFQDSTCIPKTVLIDHTARSRVLLEKLTGFQLVKKFLTFFGTRRLVTAFTSARHLSLS
jgi:hypothetical protein